MRVNGTHKRYRLRQDTTMVWGFYQVPNPYGYGWVPIKSRHPRKMMPKVPCLFRVEKEDKNKHCLRKRKEN